VAGTVELPPLGAGVVRSDEGKEPPLQLARGTVSADGNAEAGAVGTPAGAAGADCCANAGVVWLALLLLLLLRTTCADGGFVADNMWTPLLAKVVDGSFVAEASGPQLGTASGMCVLASRLATGD